MAAALAFSHVVDTRLGQGPEVSLARVYQCIHFMLPMHALHAA